MRRTDIADKAVELAKQMKDAGFPQRVEEGDWYMSWDEDGEILYCKNRNIGNESPVEVLLPSVLTCLEWLKEKHIYCYLQWEGQDWHFVMTFDDKEGVFGFDGNAPLEALYSAILAVMEGKG